jgi:hypothetical protein
MRAYIASVMHALTLYNGAYLILYSFFEEFEGQQKC